MTTLESLFSLILLHNWGFQLTLLLYILNFSTPLKQTWFEQEDFK